jgi:hypothetical protein
LRIEKISRKAIQLRRIRGMTQPDETPLGTPGRMTKQEWEEVAKLVCELKPRVKVTTNDEGTGMARMRLFPEEKQRLGEEVYRKIARAILEAENLKASDFS